jgi:hypothetical protein
VTWFKVDDQLAFHPKAIAAGNAALGLWVRAGSWCAAHVTQGALPTHMVRTLGAQRRDAEKLVSVGLWTRTEDGYEFKDWADYQPTKEQVEAKREADRLRQSRRRASVSHGVTPDVTPAVTHAVSHSTPTRPVLKGKERTTSPPAAAAGGYTEDFEEFWKHYPRKIEKADAFKAWKATIKHTAPDTLIRAVRAYRFPADPTFVKYPAVWLRKGAWEDVPAAAPVPEGSPPRPLYDVSNVPPNGQLWTKADVDRVLGPDTWTCPEPPADMDPTTLARWQHDQQLRHEGIRRHEAQELTGWRFEA